MKNQTSSERLQDDKAFFLEAVKNWGESFQYASRQLQCDRKYILALMDTILQPSLNREVEEVSELEDEDHNLTEGECMEIAAEMDAVSSSMRFLNYVSAELWTDKSFVLEVVKRWPLAFLLASPTVQSSREILDFIFSKLEEVEGASDPLPHTTPDEFWCNRAFVIEAVRRGWPETFDLASEEIKNDKGVVIEVVRASGVALEYASQELRADRDVVLEAVRENGAALKFASRAFRNDKVFVLDVVKNHGIALEFASWELRSDRDVVLEAVKENDAALKFCNLKYRNDREVVIAAVANHGSALEFASDTLKNDKDLVLTAVKCFAGARKFASVDLQCDTDVISAANTTDEADINEDIDPDDIPF